MKTMPRKAKGLKGKNQGGIVNFFVTFLAFLILLDPLPLFALTSDYANASHSQYSGFQTLVRIDLFAKAPNIIQLTWKEHGAVVEIKFSPDNGRLHFYSDANATIRYLYDEEKEEVTLLYAVSKTSEPSYYSRFTLSYDGTIGSILEEGWIKTNYFIPAKNYQYVYGQVITREYERSGRMLKIESSEGWRREFLYNRDSMMLGIKEIDPSGRITILDQIQADTGSMAPIPGQTGALDSQFTMPSGKGNGFLKKLHLSSILYAHEESAFSNLISENLYPALLGWMNTAIPVRAGPKGGN